MDNFQQKSDFSCKPTKLETFSQVFKDLYNFLDEYGEKKELHVEIQRFTQPAKSIDTIRGYCANPHTLPANNEDFYFRLMSESLFRITQKKVATARKFITDIEPFQKKLEKTVKEILNDKIQ